jgi:Domain of unknown function (DUF6458)
MGLGISIFLIAVGAILAFAVNATVSGIDLVTVGWVLMIVGAIGLLVSMAFWSRWGGFGGRRTTIVEDDRGRVL